MFGVHVDDLACAVYLQFDLGSPEFELGGLGVAHVALHLGDLGALEGVVDGLPEPGVSDMRVDGLLLEVVVLSGAGLTISRSMRYSLSILLCWKWGETKWGRQYRTCRRTRAA